MPQPRPSYFHHTLQLFLTDMCQHHLFLDNFTFNAAERITFNDHNETCFVWEPVHYFIPVSAIQRPDLSMTTYYLIPSQIYGQIEKWRQAAWCRMLLSQKMSSGIIILALIFNLQLNNQFYVKR